MQVEERTELLALDVFEWAGRSVEPVTRAMVARRLEQLQAHPTDVPVWALRTAGRCPPVREGRGTPSPWPIRWGEQRCAGPRLGRPRSDGGTIHTDAALNPGNSGGALFDMNGELIGMNSAMAALRTGSDSGGAQNGSIGIGFAIPIDHAKRIAWELVAMGTASHGWLGVQVSNGADTEGATAVCVTTPSPAAAAGLSNGVLVTRIDDQPIPSAVSLVAIVESKAPGTHVTMAFFEPSGDARTVTVTLGTDAGRG